MTPEILAALEAAKRAGRPVVLATSLPDGEQRLLPDPAAAAELNEAAERGAAPTTKAARSRSATPTGSCTSTTRRCA